ncbi:MAG TPA: protein kinase [Blastocatellia bacterium]|nr:protein kinase [Blastocatellia bacterium]
MIHEQTSKELSANTTLSHYRIISKLGAGGMGEVYRARDARLDRDVAIKVLPASFSNDEDRLRRFEQEARATSALNHPNILTIYDIGDHEGSPYIVAELLEGEELRDVLNEGMISPRRAIDYALQIVAGLGAAHEKSIVHRDLKPENLFVTKDGRIKILDFGLAKLRTAKVASGASSEIVTQRAITDPGTIMGTVGYMSPEQVRGQNADHRSDIFSFGAILYEMLGGRRAFQRETMAETMTAILKEEPQDLDGTNSRINPALEKLMQRCLEKKPERRFQSTSDLGFALEALSAPTSSSGDWATANTQIDEKEKASTWRSRMPWMVVGALALMLFVLSVAFFNRPSSEARAARLSFTPPPNLSFNDAQVDAAVISPDGQKIAFSATSADGKNMLYVREINSSDAKLLPGSENPLEPFWSPDSRSLAFGSNGKLKRSDLSGGNAQVLCDAARMTGGTWSKDGVIVFGPDYRITFSQVSAQGGEPKQLIFKTDDNADERLQGPYFLPDGRHYLFRRNLGGDSKGIWIGSLDSQEIKLLTTNDSPFVYAPPGWLIFVRNETLVAQAFDASSITLSGEPVPIITGQVNELGNARRFSVSDNGVLVWQGKWQRDYQLVWFDREGKQTGTVDAPMKVFVGQDPALSPDGKRVVVKRDSNLWVIDLAKGTGLRITSTFSQIPTWSPDGSRIVFSGGNGGMSVKASNGLGDAELLLFGANFPAAWSPDGRFIIYLRRGVKTRRDMWVLPTFGDKKEYLLLNSSFDENNPQLSPNGRWLAYATDETGNYEIYVQSFSTDGRLGADKKRVSTSGGTFPVWRRDGSELFFVAADGQMMSSSVKTDGSEFEFGPPKALFKTRMLAWGTNFHEFDVSPDGQRFLIGTLIGEAKAPPPMVILNWTAEIKK